MTVIKDKKDYDETIEYPCGCVAEIEWIDSAKGKHFDKMPQWVISSFCDEHDPTVERNPETGEVVEDEDELSRIKRTCPYCQKSMDVEAGETIEQDVNTCKDCGAVTLGPDHANYWKVGMNCEVDSICEPTDKHNGEQATIVKVHEACDEHSLCYDIRLAGGTTELEVAPEDISIL